MASSIVTVPYSGSLVQGTFTTPFPVAVTGYLWGAGGGAGGNDSSRGGNGQGGGFSQIDFIVQPGQTMKVAIGGGGGSGGGGANAAGGTAGASWLGANYNLPTDGVVPDVLYYTPYSYPAYAQFVNRYGIWNGQGYYYWYVYFPTSREYALTIGADNHAWLYIDDVLIIETPGDSSFSSPVSTSTFVSQGFHTIKINAVDYGPPGCVAAAMDNGWTTQSARFPPTTSYGGAVGGRSGPQGSSGSGGGGGGSTVVLLNDTVVGVAAGGGAGGGGGNVDAATGAAAPGGYGTSNNSAGQNGQNKGGDGGGGGAGGGGYRGGNGGPCRGGDQGGEAGVGGTSLGTLTANPSGVTPGASTNQYYVSGVGIGGVNSVSAAAGNGYAVFVFTLGGTYVNQAGSWAAVSQTYVKQSGVWQPVSVVYVKSNGQWIPTQGSVPITFSAVSGNYGTQPRPN